MQIIKLELTNNNSPIRLAKVLSPITKLMLLIWMLIINFQIDTAVMVALMVMMVALMGVELSKIKVSIKYLCYLFVIIVIPVVFMQTTPFWELLVNSEFWVSELLPIFFRLFKIWLPIVIYLGTNQINEIEYCLSKVLKPLSFFKIPYHGIVLTFTIAYNFIPVLLQELNHILVTQAIRGDDFRSATFVNKFLIIKSSLLPLLVSTMRKIQVLIDALEVKQYDATKPRSSYQVYGFSKVDGFVMLLMVLSFVLVK